MYIRIEKGIVRCWVAIIIILVAMNATIGFDLSSIVVANIHSQRSPNSAVISDHREIIMSVVEDLLINKMNARSIGISAADSDLIIKIKENDTLWLRQYFADNPQLKNKPIQLSGKTSLITAIDFDNKEAVKFLLNMGVDANACDSNGVSPMAYCISKNDLKESVLYFEMLDNSGGDVFTKSPSYSGDLKESLLIHAFRHNRMIAKYLLLHYKLNLDTRAKNDLTPLMLACSSCDTELVKLLLNQEANPNSLAKEINVNNEVWSVTNALQDVAMHFSYAREFEAQQCLRTFELLLTSKNIDIDKKVGGNKTKDGEYFYKNKTAYDILSGEECWQLLPFNIELRKKALHLMCHYFPKKFKCREENVANSETNKHSESQRNIPMINILPGTELSTFLTFDLLQFSHGAQTITEDKNIYMIHVKVEDVVVGATTWTLIADYWMQDQRTKSLRFYKHCRKTKENTALNEALETMHQQTDKLCPQAYPKTYSSIVTDELGDSHTGTRYYWGSNVCPLSGNSVTFEVANLSKNDALIVWINK